MESGGASRGLLERGSYSGRGQLEMSLGDVVGHAGDAAPEVDVLDRKIGRAATDRLYLPIDVDHGQSGTFGVGPDQGAPRLFRKVGWDRSIGTLEAGPAVGVDLVGVERHQPFTCRLGVVGDD